MPRSSDVEVVVVGAGFTGLTVALRLAQAGRRVRVVEAASLVGGLASTWDLPSPSGDGSTLRWDRYYHVILGSDVAYRGLLRELGLDEQISWTTTRTGAAWRGRHWSVSTPAELLRFEPLRPVDRLRLGVTVLLAGRAGDPDTLDRTPLEPWLRRRSGDAAYDRFWRPQLRAKLGEGHHDVSLAFLASTAQRLLQARRSGVGAERFGYLPGGSATALEALVERLASLGVDVTAGAAVTGIVAVDGPRRLEVALADGARIRADDVVLTVPGVVAADVASSVLRDTEAAALRRVRMQGVVCVALAMRQPVSPYYLTYLLDDSVLTGIVDLAALTGRDTLHGGTVVYLPRYQAPDDPLFDAPDQALVEQFTAALQHAYPSFDPSTVTGARVARSREVFAVPTLGAAARVVPHRLAQPGLHVVNSAQIVHATLNVDESVRLGERGAVGVLHASGAVAPRSRPFASLSLDLDNEWSYLMVRGDAAWRDHPTYLPTVVPRALDVLRDLGLRITFFVVGVDADDARNHEALRSVVDAGHEIGNHSYRHEPWLHTYTYDRLVDDFDRAEAALERLTGRRPDGFRGPGYSLALDVLRILAARGYRYDASTLPTYLGPVSRAFYFRAAKLDAAQRAERAQLFGTLRDGRRPLRAYGWPVQGAAGGSITEIPVTTLPVLRVPIHVSYLLALAAHSPWLARRYFGVALRLCERTGVAPSILLHPLDLVGTDVVPSLSFFPAMSLRSERKAELVRSFLAQLQDRYEVVPIGEHARRVTATGPLTIRHRDPMVATR